ncbi:MAG: hypothetical protein VYE19_06030, partial [Chloroflexota bacterium]|nr:hypothetical protein [Chloroflexota bacterium]
HSQRRLKLERIDETLNERGRFRPRLFFWLVVELLSPYCRAIRPLFWEITFPWPVEFIRVFVALSVTKTFPKTFPLIPFTTNHRVFQGEGRFSFDWGS